MKMASARRSRSAYSLLHLAEDAHAQAGAGEGMAIDHLVRQAERQADSRTSSLNSSRSGSTSLSSCLGQAADVVVALDDVRLAGLAAGRLDHVRVDGALGQPLDAFELARLGRTPR
jgi:hypothetical protein